MEYNYRRIYIILGIFLLVSVFVGGTLGFYQWVTSSSQRTNVVFTTEQDYSCAADGGGDIVSGTLMPVSSCLNSEYAIQREITVTPTINSSDTAISMDLWLKINQIGSGLSNSENLRYALTTNSSSCTEDIVIEGKFYGKTAATDNNQLPLLTQKQYSTTTEEKYYLYIWIDSAETSSSIVNQNLNLTLGGSCTDKPYPSKPVIDSGMIPVTIANDGTVTTISSDDESWYDYENKKWANVVLVNSSSRSNYQNTSGVTVNSSDILAYYVWIPRYKYRVWTTSKSSKGKEQEIDIAFEPRTASYSVATAVGQYQTHPAFWWDNDDDGVVDSDELTSGFWVGKFETTGSATTPTVLPNVTSLRSQNVSTQFQTSLKFSGGTLSNGIVSFAGSDTYGLSSKTDSHMMKNSEWGAVAYLSHSKYGINQEIYINNSSGYYTGRSGGNVGGNNNTLAVQFPNDSTSTDKYNSYGYYTWLGQTINYSGTIGNFAEDRTLGTNASTTGNVTGVYDMSGGAWEYSMSVYADSNGKPRSGYSTSYNSGFNRHSCYLYTSAS